MDRLESDLREEFARRVATPPSVAHLADAALLSGKRARRRRRAVVGSSAAAVVVVVALAMTSLVPRLTDRSSDVAAASLKGPPRVPMFIGQDGEVIDWVGGTMRVRQLRDAWPVAEVPSGLLVVTGSPLSLGLLGSDDTPHILFRGLGFEGAAVARDGRRATVVVGAGGLREIELPSGRLLRSVDDVGQGEQVIPVAYSARAVLLTAGEGTKQYAMVWHSGGDGVVAVLDGAAAAEDGADADFSNERDAVGGRGAFAVREDRCRTEIRQLRAAAGPLWRLCREPFAGFSPDGGAVLATNALGTGLIVHRASDGRVLRTFEADRGMQAHAWESNDAVLYTTVKRDRTVIVRCSIRSGRCATAAELPFADRGMVMVPTAG